MTTIFDLPKDVIIYLLTIDKDNINYLPEPVLLLTCDWFYQFYNDFYTSIGCTNEENKIFLNTLLVYKNILSLDAPSLGSIFEINHIPFQTDDIIMNRYLNACIDSIHTNKWVEYDVGVQKINIKTHLLYTIAFDVVYNLLDEETIEIIKNPIHWNHLWNFTEELLLFDPYMCRFKIKYMDDFTFCVVDDIDDPKYDDYRNISVYSGKDFDHASDTVDIAAKFCINVVNELFLLINRNQRYNFITVKDKIVSSRGQGWWIVYVEQSCL